MGSFCPRDPATNPSPVKDHANSDCLEKEELSQDFRRIQRIICFCRSRAENVNARTGTLIRNALSSSHLFPVGWLSGSDLVEQSDYQMLLWLMFIRLFGSKYPCLSGILMASHLSFWIFSYPFFNQAGYYLPTFSTMLSLSGSWDLPVNWLEASWNQSMEPVKEKLIF